MSLYEDTSYPNLSTWAWSTDIYKLFQYSSSGFLEKQSWKYFLTWGCFKLVFFPFSLPPWKIKLVLHCKHIWCGLLDGGKLGFRDRSWHHSWKQQCQVCRRIGTKQPFRHERIHGILMLLWPHKKAVNILISSQDLLLRNSPFLSLITWFEWQQTIVLPFPTTWSPLLGLG